jgi:hypothetical protein
MENELKRGTAPAPIRNPVEVVLAYRGRYCEAVPDKAGDGTPHAAGSAFCLWSV